MARSSDFTRYKTVTAPEQFKIAWEPFYTKASAESEALRQRFKATTDIAYGSSEYQTLDLYLPDHVDDKTPTLVFLRGGAFREGHPAQYGFVGKPFLERGHAFISAGYRLAPEAFYPDHVQDMVLLSKWLFEHLPKHGLNPNRIVMSGHSSGALMIALAAVRNDWQADAGVPANALDSIIIAGANYDHSYEFAENLVRDPSRREEGTVLLNIARVPESVIMIFGRNELNTGDGTRFERSGRPLAEALTARGSIVQVFALDGHHQDTCAAICDETSSAFAAVLRVMKSAAAKVAQGRAINR